MTKKRSLASKSNSIKRVHNTSESHTLNEINLYQSNTMSLLIGSLFLFLVFSTIALPGLIQGVQEEAETSENSPFHSTIIPSIQNSNICRKTARKWEDGKCWDIEHSPNF
jgi:hypothetical protein